MQAELRLREEFRGARPGRTPAYLDGRRATDTLAFDRVGYHTGGGQGKATAGQFSRTCDKFHLSATIGRADAKPATTTAHRIHGSRNADHNQHACQHSRSTEQSSATAAAATTAEAIAEHTHHSHFPLKSSSRVQSSTTAATPVGRWSGQRRFLGQSARRFRHALHVTTAT